MRRGAVWAMALALGIGGMAACGDDGGDAASGGTTSTTASTTSADSGDEATDLTAAVDEFCDRSEEFQTILMSQSESAAGPVDPSTSEAASDRLSELTGEVTGMLMSLQGQVAQMIPSVAARFQECAALFGGGVNMPPS